MWKSKTKPIQDGINSRSTEEGTDKRSAEEGIKLSREYIRDQQRRESHLFVSVQRVNISSASAVITNPSGTQCDQATLQDQVYRYF